MRNEYDFSSGKRGSVVASPGKTRITIMLDDDIIELFRRKADASGSGYQTEINRVLREYLVSGGQPITLDALRKVIREELHAA
ncbi:MAG: BrnA antitoxin family protein [Xanthomonadales bacterium]|nr:BrnA antitoxin family protein [Xanthomonadales bacterium]